MMKFDEMMLMAYVDGELDAETAREIEVALALDPEAQKIVDQLRQSTAMVRAAFNDPMHREVPSHLMARLTGRLTAEPEPSGHRGIEGAARRPRQGETRLARYLMPVAASFIALVVGVGGGYALFGLTDSFTIEVASGGEAADDGHIADVIYRALETKAGGREITWRNAATGHSGAVATIKGFVTSGGQVCREFRSTVTLPAETRARPRIRHGLGCRLKDGSWETLWLQARNR
jgi:surface antigen